MIEGKLVRRKKVSVRFQKLASELEYWKWIERIDEEAACGKK